MDRRSRRGRENNGAAEGNVSAACGGRPPPARCRYARRASPAAACPAKGSLLEIERSFHTDVLKFRWNNTAALGTPRGVGISAQVVPTRGTVAEAVRFSLRPEYGYHG